MQKELEDLLITYAQADNKILQREVEKTLWQRYGTHKAVLVMDMSGFSRLTQKYGIVHYLSMVQRMQATSLPIVENLGGKVVKFEADNCFAMFEQTLAAVRAAIRLNTAFDAINRFSDDPFDIRVAIGIDEGDVLLTDEPDYFGEAVNAASKLGEDIAGPGEILLTERAFAQLPAQAGYTGESIEPVLGGVRIKAYNLFYKNP
jgi:class 3 adenylate cyclase